jgi:regulator of protease activity HflC (stomatin/prohibitin superfamily)
MSMWFYPLATSIALVPVEDCQTTFVVAERTTDLQPVSVQCSVTFRFADAEKAASRSNFSLSLTTGRWIENPLEKIANFLAQRVRGPVRERLASLNLADAVKVGSTLIREAVTRAIASDPELAAMGMAIVDFQVETIAPSPEITKALEAPTRESVQQKADEAVFQRRALAVEKERAIKENELATQIELARRQDELIRRENSNRELDIEGKAKANKLRASAELELARLTAEGNARDELTRAEGQAKSKLLLGEAEAKAQSLRASAWKDAPAHVLVGLAAQELAGKIQNIQSVTITPDNLSDALSKLLGKSKSNSS